MAAFSRRFVSQILGKKPLSKLLINTTESLRQHSRRTVTLLGTCGSLIIGWNLYKHRHHAQFPVVFAKAEKPEECKVAILGRREKRFLDFASVEFNGKIYMTPQDFLESVTEEAPRPRRGRTKLESPDVQTWLQKTPARSRGSTHFFRSLHDKGLLSYTEYLFLLCVLTKPHSGFGIAFNMFDTDGDKKVDKTEFLVLEKIFSVSPSEVADVMGKLKKNVWDAKTGDIDYVDTTLLVHLFGQKGKDQLRYEDFHRFMDNLQTEVLELEFQAFAKGMPTISEVDFAQILLRYTVLAEGEYDGYMERVRDRVPHEQGISFSDFKQFCQFLNCLDDFALVMRLHTFANKPVSQDEFQRAVYICTGNKLNPHVLNTVFQTFDIDGDGHLSHEEFISIMKNRLYRGSRLHSSEESRLEMFKLCVKNEMKTK